MTGCILQYSEESMGHLKCLSDFLWDPGHCDWPSYSGTWEEHEQLVEPDCRGLQVDVLNYCLTGMHSNFILLINIFPQLYTCKSNVWYIALPRICSNWKIAVYLRSASKVRLHDWNALSPSPVFIKLVFIFFKIMCMGGGTVYVRVQSTGVHRPEASSLLQWQLSE